MHICQEQAKHGRATSAGLTLVEVLVVITMTGILSAIMVPALSTAKEKTRRVVCKSNEHQVLMVLQEYANENFDYLPNSADNKGYYHAIVMSDDTFTNLVTTAGGNSNIFYCPNIVFGNGPGAVVPHTAAFGYVTGYSYLAGSVSLSTKGPDTEDNQVKMPFVGTNELIADANYWTTSTSVESSPFPSQMSIAPHTPLGAAMMRSSSFTVGPPGTTSVTLGAVGGNIGYSDMSVQWRTLPQLQTNAASSPGIDSKGLW